MAKLLDITGKARSGEWGTDDEAGTGIPVLRTTNFTNEGVIDYSNVVTRSITKKGIIDKYLRYGDIIIEKSGGSDKQPVGRVVFFEGPERTYLFNNFTGLLRVRDTKKWIPRYIFYALFARYFAGGTRQFENRTTGLHNLQTDAYVNCVEIAEITIAQQRYICNLLDTTKKIIADHKEQLSMLDSLIKARFVEMFGEPISNSHKLPTKRLGEICQLQAGDFTPADAIHETPDESNRYPCYGGNGIRGYVDNYTQEGIFPIIGRQGALCGNVQLAHGKFRNTEHAVLVTPKTQLNVVWLFELLRLEDLYRFHTGAAQPGLAVKTLNQVVVPYAGIHLQNQYAEFFSQIDKSKFAIQQALDEAQKLFDSLMQQYFG